MFEHARLGDGGSVLYVGTGSGYGLALTATRVGDQHVTAVDIDDHVTKTASGHLDRIGLHPQLLTADATGPLPGTWDRILSTIGVPSIPVSWIDALRPGGRLVTTIAHTGLIIIADKTPDGIVGRIGWERAEFMPARSGPAYLPRLGSSFEGFRQAGGEQVSRGRYPVIDLTAAVELRSMLAVTAPGIEHLFQAHDDGRDTAWMFHADGSWARAVGARGTRPRVFQGGPRRLWDQLDRIRDRWLREGSLPLHGAHVTITPHGVIQLEHRNWKASLY